MLDQEDWYQALSLQQRNLLQSVMIQTLKDDKNIYKDKREDLMDSPENFTFMDFMHGLDIQINFLALLALSPHRFRQSFVKDGFLTSMQSWLCELVESARHRKFLNMISTAVD